MLLDALIAQSLQAQELPNTGEQVGSKHSQGPNLTQHWTLAHLIIAFATRTIAEQTSAIREPTTLRLDLTSFASSMLQRITFLMRNLHGNEQQDACHDGWFEDDLVPRGQTIG